MEDGTVLSVALDNLVSHTFNRAIYGEPRHSEGFSALVEGIRQLGVLEPIVINQNYVILNGHRRVAAARVIGLRTIPALLVRTCDDRSEQALILSLNQHRRPRTSVMVREAVALEQLAENRSKVSPSADGGREEPKAGGLGMPGRRIAARLRDQIAERVGLRNRTVLDRAHRILLSDDAELIAFMDGRTVEAAYRKLHRRRGTSSFSPAIKPSDNWNFSPIYYGSVSAERGYIPGDIYANCFWYFTKPGDVVVDPMAGSGVAQAVYDRRREWMGEHVYDFTLLLYDLTPQEAWIQNHNLLDGFPVEHADYIFLDVPYFGMAKYVYSQKPDDLANMEEIEYLAALATIAGVCARAQRPRGRCTVITPNCTDHARQRMILVPEVVRRSWQAVGYLLTTETYASRRIQQRQHPTMAKMNNVAKERRLPLTDIAVVMTFTRQ